MSACDPGRPAGPGRQGRAPQLEVSEVEAAALAFSAASAVVFSVPGFGVSVVGAVADFGAAGSPALGAGTGGFVAAGSVTGGAGVEGGGVGDAALGSDAGVVAGAFASVAGVFAADAFG